MYKHSRGFAHIFLLLIIIVVAIGGIGYLMYQNGQLRISQPTIETPTPTPHESTVKKGWESEVIQLDESSYRFKGKYFVVNLDNGWENTLDIIDTPELNEPQYQIADFTSESKFLQFDISESSEDKLNKNILEKMQSHPYGIANLIVQNKIVNSLKTTYLSGKNDYIKVVNAIVSGGQRRSLIRLESTDKSVNLQQLTSELDQILSTFEFVDNASANSMTDWKSFTSSTGLKIKYPNNWVIESQTLQVGESVKESGKYDVIATNDSLEIIDLVRNDWQIRIVVGKALDNLGGQGTISNLESYKKIPIFGRNALRTKIEDGYQPFSANHPEPYPFPIEFQRKAGETLQSFPQPDSDGSYVTLFSTNDENNQININVTIYSDQLTDTNLTNKNFDSEIINEIDQILSALQYAD